MVCMQYTSSTRQTLHVLEVARATERRLDRALSGIRGISFSEYRLLSALRDTPAATASRVELADQTGLTPSAITRALKPLEKLGYVTTARGERDAREVRSTLTEHGQVLVTDADAVIDNVVSSITTFRIDDAAAGGLRDIVAALPEIAGETATPEN